MVAHCTLPSGGPLHDKCRSSWATLESVEEGKQQSSIDFIILFIIFLQGGGAIGRGFDFKFPLSNWSLPEDCSGMTWEGDVEGG